MTTEPEKEVKKTPAPTPVALATHLINDENLRNSIKRLLPLGEINLDQFCSSVSLYLIQKVNELREASYEDLKHCILDGARYGFIIGGSFTHADIIIRNKKPKLETGMHGIRELAFRSGLIKSMEGAVIYEGDTFRCNLGDDVSPIFHQPDLTRHPEKIVGVYILTIYTNGVKKVQVMGEPEMKSLQAEAKAKASDKGWPYSPWNRFLPQMCLKTLLKRASKQIPFRASNAASFQLLHDAISSEKEEEDKKDSPTLSKELEKPRKNALEFINEVINTPESTHNEETGEILEETEPGV